MAQQKPAHKGPHKYARVSWGKKGTIIYRCLLAGCAHYVHPEFLEGRVSVCWDCSRPFIIEGKQLPKPICSNCRLEDKTDKLRKAKTKQPSALEKLSGLIS